MSSYILCRKEKAEVPYYIESVSTNIYTMEELCFFLYRNICLADETLLNQELFQWLDEELHFTRLSKRLWSMTENDAARDGLILSILKEINYLSYEELKDYQNRMKQFEQESRVTQQKQKGDSLVENGMYVNAIKVYQSILGDMEKENDRTVGSLYHNLGCAYSYLFQKEEALDCFQKAYEKNHTGQTLKNYLYAFYNTRTPIEYESKLIELGVDPKTKAQVKQEIDEAWGKEGTEPYGQNLDAMLAKLTEEYHRSTGS